MAIERRQNVKHSPGIYFVFKRVALLINCLKSASPFLVGRSGQFLNVSESQFQLRLLFQSQLENGNNYHTQAIEF